MICEIIPRLDGLNLDIYNNKKKSVTAIISTKITFDNYQ